MDFLVVAVLLFLVVGAHRLSQWISGGDADRKQGLLDERSHHEEHAESLDLWQSRYQNIPLKFYGGGADHPFEHYFSGASGVAVSSVDEVVRWLLECEYVTDPEQFRKRDHWQHPVDFEKTRRGDCEDFALWAWRKLVELGHDAEFMVGKWVRGSRAGTHAGVLLEYDGEHYLFESTGRAFNRVMRPYEQAFPHYIPFASVDRDMRKKVYNGLAHWVMRQA